MGVFGISSAAAALMVALVTGAAAETAPGRGQHDVRVRVATFVDGEVFRLATSLLNVTTVEFGPGETIASVVAGDTEGFELGEIPGGRAFAIKPLATGVQTNVTVYTNQRSYYFNVVEGGDPTYFVVRFAYPGASAPPRNAVVATAPNARYGVSGEAEFTPTSIYDDGTFTYFQFPRGAPLPAILRVGADGERTVNSTTQANGVVRVSGLSARWVLRLGEQVVCVQVVSPERPR